MGWCRCVLLAGVVSLCGAPIAASDLEDRLVLRLRGAWSVLEVEAYSECSGTYSNNRASGTLVTSGANRRFEPGELSKVDKVNLKRSRLDLFLTLAEPVLVSRVDGPFELFDESECRVQLMVEVPRPLVKAGDEAAIMNLVGQTIELHSTQESARASAVCNGRQRRPFPDDYELTLERYEVWKAEQHNVAVVARAAQALDDADRAVQRIRRDQSYLDGFGAGAEIMRSWSEDDCADLVDVRFDREDHDPPSKHDDDRAWCDGYRDGQELVFNLRLAHRLESCLVPVPQA